MCYRIQGFMEKVNTEEDGSFLFQNLEGRSYEFSWGIARLYELE